jgi:hypothetical protein
LLTTARTLFAPHVAEGAVHEYQVRPMGGTAESVSFVDGM